MPSRVAINKERKLPKISVSIEPSIADRFAVCCANEDTSVSREIRRFINEYIEQHYGKDKTKK